MGSAIYWIIIAVLFVAFLVFFIKWLLLRGEIKKENVEEEIISMVDEGFEILRLSMRKVHLRKQKR